MSEFVTICSKADLPGEGEAKEFAAPSGRPLCVARVNGVLSAMENECPHNGGPLSEGMVEEGKVVCPWHAWAFDTVTGAAEHNSAAKVEIFAIKVEGEAVMVQV